MKKPVKIGIISAAAALGLGTLGLGGYAVNGKIEESAATELRVADLERNVKGYGAVVGELQKSAQHMQSIQMELDRKKDAYFTTEERVTQLERGSAVLARELAVVKTTIPEEGYGRKFEVMHERLAGLESRADTATDRIGYVRRDLLTTVDRLGTLQGEVAQNERALQEKAKYHDFTVENALNPSARFDPMYEMLIANQNKADIFVGEPGQNFNYKLGAELTRSALAKGPEYALSEVLPFVSATGFEGRERETLIAKIAEVTREHYNMD